MAELNAHILLEGSYLFYEKDVNYSQENFKFVHYPDLQQYHLYAEILSRVETGEFLKILVRYEMNHHYIPINIRVEKNMGNQNAVELYEVDTTEQELHYSFQNSQGTEEYKRPLNARHYLTTPSFATSTFFTLTKKFDQTGRTAVVFLSSPNDWNYVGQLEEKVIFGEFKSRESTEFKINEKELEAYHLCLYEHSALEHSDEEPVNLYISKYHGIPYELLHGDKKIIAKALKKNY